ncbi:Sua5/YciO/YrdC/YwlC family protein [Candidatus Minimicrobia naudis]
MANSNRAVERLYEVKQRPLNNSVIVLVADIDDIPDLTPSLTRKLSRNLQKATNNNHHQSES